MGQQDLKKTSKRGEPSMYRNQRFNFECDENSHLKLKDLSGKNNFQQRDFQKVIEKMIDYVYHERNGKTLK